MGRGAAQNTLATGASRPEGGRDRVLSRRSKMSGATEPRERQVSAHG